MPKPCYRTRLMLDTDSKIQLMEMLKAARLAWNECSKVKFESVPSNDIRELHAVFYQEFRKSHPEIPSQLVYSAQRGVVSTYKSIKTQKREISKPAEKKSLSLQLSKNICSHKNGKMRISTLGKRVSAFLMPCPKLAEMLTKYGCSQPRIVVKGEEVWVQFCFDVPENKKPGSLAVGVDLGLRVTAATSEGNLYIDKKFNGEKRRLRYLKKCLKSRGTRSAKRHLQKLGKKEGNKNKNFAHNLAKRIITDTKADTISVENLQGIKGRTKSQRLSQVPLAQIRQFLTHKAPMYGKTVIAVDPSYTSQIDHQTGNCDGIRNGRRYYSRTGLIYDSDVNAAINIGLRSKLPVSQAVGLTYGQVVANRPIVGGCKPQTNNWLLNTRKWSISSFTSWPESIFYGEFSPVWYQRQK